MINDVNPADKSGNEDHNNVTELSEDMVMVSPGAMLREARNALSLSQEHIASRLNLKVSLVQNIEEDLFDPSMPVTFNRGYLTNFAKLVGVEVEDILASYDALDAASLQRSEMLSFSKETSKQAEHSRVMWLSYLIVAVLAGLTVLWWQQNSNQLDVNLPDISMNTPSDNTSQVNNTEEKTASEKLDVVTPQVELSLTDAVVEITEDKALADTSTKVELEQSIVESQTAEPANPNTIEQSKEVEAPDVPALSTAVFTFKGDCWVNIFDANDERIAWGVKKSGYVMTIQGKAPLRITVGKPELTSIVFNDQAVDMSSFDAGNIAKFNLPLVAE
jgi:cytoskeleton protein RodZ